MAVFKLKVTMDNSAFDDREELPRILRALADRLENEKTYMGNVRDINGNTVGNFIVEDEE